MNNPGLFSLLPKLDALFVPGGDPGELEPDELFSWLGKVALVKDVLGTKEYIIEP